MKYKNNEIIIRNALESEFQRSTSSSYHGRSCTRCDGARIDFWARDKKKRKIGARFRATHNWTQKWTRTINSRDTKSQVRHQFLEYRVPLSSTPPSFQHISSTKKGHSFSAPEIRQFHTKNPWDPHQKPLSSTQKTLQFHTQTPQFHTKTLQVHTENPSVPYIPQFNTLLSSAPKTPQLKKIALFVLNWGIFGVELRCVELGVFDVELMGFWCWTEGFWVLKRCGPCVELMCWT